VLPWFPASTYNQPSDADDDPTKQTYAPRSSATALPQTRAVLSDCVRSPAALCPTDVAPEPIAVAAEEGRTDKLRTGGIYSRNESVSIAPATRTETAVCEWEFQTICRSNHGDDARGVDGDSTALVDSASPK
jgi:hypothetical protein